MKDKKRYYYDNSPKVNSSTTSQYIKLILSMDR